MSGGKKGTGRNIEYKAQPVPKFLQQFKQRTGYKEGPSVKDKFADGDQQCVDSDPDKSDEEGPVVVVLKSGDLTREEAEKILGKKRKIGDSDDDDDGSGKIKFRQPKKKKEKADTGGDSGSEKKSDGSDKPVKKKKQRRPPNGPKNTSLLSFEEDEDR